MKKRVLYQSDLVLVQEAASVLNTGLQALPAYGPDFMTVEHPRQWLREDITYLSCLL